MRYRKKPIEIEARQWSGSLTEATKVINWVLENGGTARYHEDADGKTAHLEVDTLEGTTQAQPTWFIIKDVEGKFYPCHPRIFDATYEKV